MPGYNTVPSHQYIPHEMSFNMAHKSEPHPSGGTKRLLNLMANVGEGVCHITSQENSFKEAHKPELQVCNCETGRRKWIPPERAFVHCASTDMHGQGGHLLWLLLTVLEA